MDISTTKGVRLLALDGGEIRAISQLRILETLMHRINHERSIPLLPCQYFHLIIGTGTGGIIAILLVVFRLTAEEAMGEFLKVYHSVWRGGARNNRPQKRSECLRKAIETLLDARFIAHDERLLSETSRIDSCLVSVCVASAADLATCRKFRNYQCRETQAKPTIIEAICATVAFPLLFESVRVGPPNRDEEFVGCKFFFNNPTREALREACTQFGRDQPVAAVISLGCGKALPISLSSNMSEKEYAELLEIVASDSEQVAEDLQRQLGQSDYSPYYRLSLDQAIDTDSLNVRIQEKILSHTAAYLEGAQGIHILDRCVNACENPGRATLLDLTQFREQLAMTGGLPPLSPFLVNREKEMQQLELYLFKPSGASVVVVSGLGGSGKTQLVAKFVRNFLAQLPIIIWIDASSDQTIRSSIVEQVRGLGQNCNDWKEGLRILSKWDAKLRGRWLVVFDNADKDSIRLVEYFPSHDQGYIIVTTRDERRKSLSPFAHLRLASMSAEEGIQAFINAAFGTTVPDVHQFQEAGKIVDALGCLPAAVTQAGCYVRDTGCLSDYLNRLEGSRPKILSKTVGEQLDNYNRTVHQVFHVTMKERSVEERKFLFLLSCAHHTGFPRSLIPLASQHHFRLEPCDFITRSEAGAQEFSILYAIFCPSGEWDAADFDDLLERLQSASLITTIPSTEHDGLLNVHPLLHAWIHEQLSSEQKQVFRSALARLLSCGAGSDGAHLHEHLISHINALSPHWKEIHANDRASFADLLAFPGIADHAVELWEGVYAEVVEVHGQRSREAYHVAHRLAWAYETQGDSKRAQDIHTKLTSTGEGLDASPSRHPNEQPGPPTPADQGEGQLEALGRLEQLRLSDKRDPETFLEVSILEQIADPEQTFDSELQSRLLGETKMKQAALSLASKFEEEERYQEAEILGQELVRVRTRPHATVPRTEIVWAQEYLSSAYERRGKYEVATSLRSTIYHARCAMEGPHGIGTQEAIRRLSLNYGAQGRYSEAEALLRYLLGQANDAAAYRQSILKDLQELADRCEMNGDRHRAEVLRAEFNLEGTLLGHGTGMIISSALEARPAPFIDGETTIRARNESRQQHSSLGIDTTLGRNQTPGTRGSHSAASTRNLAVYGVFVSESPDTYTDSPQRSYVGATTPITSKTLSPPLSAHQDKETSNLEFQAVEFERQGMMSRAAAIRRDIARIKSSERLRLDQ